VKHFAVFALASAAALPGAALAQAAAPAQAPATGAATVATGATVYDTSGGVVGTVESTDGTNAVVNTGTVKAAIPLTSLGQGAQGPVLAMTKAQLEAAAGQQQAQATADFKSKLVPGATVYGTGGTQLGTIKSVDASGVTLTTADGPVVLPANGFGPGPQGIVLGMTAAQLKAAMTAAGGGSAGASSSSSSSTTAGDMAAGTTAATGTESASTPGTTAEASTAAPGATTTTTKAKRKPR
jgi:preprotein translocase subunit YajC